MLERRAPAKINLGLHVLRKRSDGYHDIETVFLRIPWTDRLTVEPAEELAMTCSDSALPTDEANLCMQAALRLAEAFGVEPGARIHLEKRVPYGAGLGGGSSDAAATLALLNELWSLGASREALRAIGAEIGSDVPFFLREAPAAYATGRGTEIAPFRGASSAPYRCPFTLVVAVPPVHVSTPWAYRHVSPQAERRPDLRAVVASNDLGRWRRALVNDFEAPVMKAHPEIRAVKEALIGAGAAYAALSGSGSAVFGVFTGAEAAHTAAAASREQGGRTFVVPA